MPDGSTSPNFKFWEKLRIGQRVNHVGNAALERFVLYELFVNFGIVIEKGQHHAGKGLVVLDPSCVRSVLAGILVGSVGRDPWHNVITDALRHAVSVVEQRPEMVVERL